MNTTTGSADDCVCECARLAIKSYKPSFSLVLTLSISSIILHSIHQFHQSFITLVQIHFDHWTYFFDPLSLSDLLFLTSFPQGIFDNRSPLRPFSNGNSFDITCNLITDDYTETCNSQINNRDAKYSSESDYGYHRVMSIICPTFNLCILYKNTVLACIK